MSPRVSLAVVILACGLSSRASADDFVPSRDGAALDQPSGPRTIGPLKGGAVYPLLKRGGPAQAWCKLRLPEGPAWVRCADGTVRGGEGAGPSQRPEQQRPEQQRPEQQRPVGAPGFDYYLLSLSWSPTFCGQGADRSPEQCAAGKRFGFVVHGLWPQSTAGMGPMSCPVSARPDDALVGSMLDLMPSRRLVQHEWEKHGSCSGLSPADYFARARAARAAIRIPAPLREPTQPVRATLEQIEALFIAENPGLTGDMMAVQCRGQVSEIRFCLDRELRPRSCGRRVRDACAGSALFPPIR